MRSSIGGGFAALAFIEAMERFTEMERVRNAWKSEMLEPGGLACHTWPVPLVRPYETVRWNSDSRQQRRSRERKARNA